MLQFHENTGDVSLCFCYTAKKTRTNVPCVFGDGETSWGFALDQFFMNIQAPLGGGVSCVSSKHRKPSPVFSSMHHILFNQHLPYINSGVRGGTPRAGVLGGRSLPPPVADEGRRMSQAKRAGRVSSCERRHATIELAGNQIPGRGLGGTEPAAASGGCRQAEESRETSGSRELLRPKARDD